MKKLLAIAALLLASHHRPGPVHLRIWRPHHPRRSRPRHRSIPGVYDNTGRKAKRSRDDEGDLDRPRRPRRSRRRPVRRPHPLRRHRRQRRRRPSRPPLPAQLPHRFPQPLRRLRRRPTSTSTAAAAGCAGTDPRRPSLPLRQRTGACTARRAGAAAAPQKQAAAPAAGGGCRPRILRSGCG